MTSSPASIHLRVATCSLLATPFQGGPFEGLTHLIHPLLYMRQNGSVCYIHIGLPKGEM